MSEIAGYRFRLTCPSCGARMSPAGVSHPNGETAAAVAECGCGVQARVDVRLTVVRKAVPKSEPSVYRLPLEPWLDLFETVEEAALCSGWARSTLSRHVAAGITERQADHLAMLVNRHPGSLWPEHYRQVVGA